MINTNFLKTAGFFKNKILKKGEVLIEEGSVDNNLYIIEYGALSIEKYVNKEKTETKNLAYIYAGEFLGEGSFKSSKPKEVKVVAQSKCRLLYINAKKGFDSFLEKHPKEGKNLLVQIIEETNKRLIIANNYITTIYSINKKIKELTNVDYKAIFKLIDDIKNLLEAKYSIFLEENIVLENYLSYKYDTRDKGMMQDKVIELEKNGHLDSFLEELNINTEEDQILFRKINIGTDVLGYIIVGRKKHFSIEEKRIVSGLTNSLAGVLKYKKILKEERDKIYMKG